MRYTFDETGSVIGFSTHYPNFTNGYWEDYLFAKNLQGDVVAMYLITVEPPRLIATYEYDEWGKVKTVRDATGAILTDPAHLANRNPFRYRGYHYDTETGFYYLQSRYYDPTISRFINADSYGSTGQAFLGTNMFVYCLNCPTSYIDEDGEEALALVAKWTIAVVPTSVSLGPIGWIAIGVVGLTFVGAIVIDTFKYTSTTTVKSKGKAGKVTRTAQKLAGKSTTASPPPPGSNKNSSQNRQFSSKTLYNKNGVRVDYEYNGNGSGNVHIQIKGDVHKYYFNPSSNQLIIEGGMLAPPAIQKLLQNPSIMRSLQKGLEIIRSLGGN